LDCDTQAVADENKEHLAWSAWVDTNRIYHLAESIDLATIRQTIRGAELLLLRET